MQYITNANFWFNRTDELLLITLFGDIVLNQVNLINANAKVIYVSNVVTENTLESSTSDLW